jgi:hypothetical protein
LGKDTSSVPVLGDESVMVAQGTLKPITLRPAWQSYNKKVLLVFDHLISIRRKKYGIIKSLSGTPKTQPDTPNKSVRNKIN